MKVYELMNILADMPSGADVLCGGAFTANELINCENSGSNDNGKDVYSFAKDVIDVENIEDVVYINF